MPLSWTKNWKILILAVGLVVIVAGFGFWLQSQPTQTAQDDINVSSQNTELYLTLANASITNAVVDITDERAFVRYNVPENMSKNESIYYTLGATARVANQSNRIVLEVYQDMEADERVTVETEAVRAFLNNESTMEELQTKINREPLQTPS